MFFVRTLVSSESFVSGETFVSGYAGCACTLANETSHEMEFQLHTFSYTRRRKDREKSASN